MENTNSNNNFGTEQPAQAWIPWMTPGVRDFIIDKSRRRGLDSMYP